MAFDYWKNKKGEEPHDPPTDRALLALARPYTECTYHKPCDACIKEGVQLRGNPAVAGSVRL